MTEDSVDVEISTMIFKIKMTKMKLMGTNDFTFFSTVLQDQYTKEWDWRQKRIRNNYKMLSAKELIASNKQLDKNIADAIVKLKKLKLQQLQLTYPTLSENELGRISWALSLSNNAPRPISIKTPIPKKTPISRKPTSKEPRISKKTSISRKPPTAKQLLTSKKTPIARKSPPASKKPQISKKLPTSEKSPISKKPPTSKKLGLQISKKSTTKKSPNCKKPLASKKPSLKTKKNESKMSKKT